MNLPRRLVLQMAAAAASAVPRVGWALDYPARPVHVIVGFPAGGPTDIYARLIGQWLSQRLGQSFVVENRPGAGSTIGVAAVVTAPPDGYTLLLVSTSATIAASYYKNLSFNLARDITPVCGISLEPLVMVVHPSVPAKTVPEFIAYAKSKPGKVVMASVGNGTTPHLAGELFMMMAGVKLLHVPYHGAAPALTDLLGGQVQVVALDIPVVISQIQAGKLVPIGIAGDERDAVLPNVPTLAEQGYPNTDASNWYALLAPAKTPPAVIAKLNKAVNDALADPGLHDKLVKTGATPVGGTPEALGTFMKAQYDKWGRIIKDNDIKPE